MIHTSSFVTSEMMPEVMRQIRASEKIKRDEERALRPARSALAAALRVFEPYDFYDLPDDVCLALLFMNSRSAAVRAARRFKLVSASLSEYQIDCIVGTAVYIAAVGISGEVDDFHPFSPVGAWWADFAVAMFEARS